MTACRTAAGTQAAVEYLRLAGAEAHFRRRGFADYADRVAAEMAERRRWLLVGEREWLAARGVVLP